MATREVSRTPQLLLGQVANTGPHRYRAVWPDREGVEWSAEFTTEREVVACVAAKAVGGMRFHDLRHAYATWLVPDGVPVNLVQRIIGHEQASTTLDRYTHTPADYAARILDAFTLPADDLLTPAAEPPAESLCVGDLPWPAVERSAREETTPVGGSLVDVVGQCQRVSLPVVPPSVSCRL
ncbi:tyrosine-type recombinase/integrase [Micromonospora sp. IBHARD004]|uniref:tyrosine-type recombinase/integrase n=1 Tax=Micromonospora sp. IBHARD004 TaxID=3457764 RepID=UPI0040588524